MLNILRYLLLPKACLSIALILSSLHILYANAGIRAIQLTELKPQK